MYVLISSDLLQQEQREYAKMIKGLIVDDSMSNLTFASGEISGSSSTRNESANLYPQQQSSASTNAPPPPPPPKKKRSLPGNPDPEAEVVALSPKTLLATNRFICEICNKGFQRDQNLQLHRRGHNLPWKLKQRTNKEVVRKKVYVCPEPTCVHHDPSRALGDLTGIKKHFFRKHGEKKWKCEKCSKRYAVQSDWKAHSKICGTREYRCDCGTLFSRRDSFITHRAFCDALAQETTTNTARAMMSNSALNNNNNPLLLSASSSSQPFLLPPQLDNTMSQFAGGLNSLVKREIVQDAVVNVPPWLSPPLFSPPTPNNIVLDHSLLQQQQVMLSQKPSKNPSPTPPPLAFASATALLQKAAQMGATMSSNNNNVINLSSSPPFFKAHHQMMMSPESSCTNNMRGPNAAISAHHHHQMLMDQAASSATSTTHDHDHHHHHHNFEAAAHSSLVHDMMTSLQTSTMMTGTLSFGDQAAVSGGGGNFLEVPSRSSTTGRTGNASVVGSKNNNNTNVNDGLTRDFLGLRTFPARRDQIFNIVGLDQHMNSTAFGDHHQKHNQPDHHHQTPWQG